MDWNIIMQKTVEDAEVEAYTASWIEISKVWKAYPVIAVEAYTASWIEIFY